MSKLSTPKFRAEVLAFVLQKRWRGEVGIIRHFTRKVHVPGGWSRERTQSTIEDALFDLVLRGKLEWFGAEGRGDKPIRYRALRGRRRRESRRRRFAMGDEWHADAKLIREVLESRSDIGEKLSGPRLVGWHEAIEALARLEQRITRLEVESQGKDA